jgi:hypothetical protein
MKIRMLNLWMAVSLILMTSSTRAFAETPTWTFTPLTSTQQQVFNNTNPIIQYSVTNQSSKSSHTLVMRQIPGITPITTGNGVCQNPFKLAPRASCILKLLVTGSSFSNSINSGPIVCQQNSSMCYQPSPDDALKITRIHGNAPTTLSISVSDLALSVAGHTEYGVPGLPPSGDTRIITIQNTGQASALDVVVSSTLPTGTTSTTNCSAVLPSGESCTINVTPGNVATSDGARPCSDAASTHRPIPDVLKVSGSNTNTATANILILNYGCIYQGGYVFALDDTTPNTGSVGGKAAAILNSPLSSQWSSNLPSEVYGISESSTAATPNPTTGQLTGQIACNGNTDGACDTNNISIYFNANPATNAAEICTQLINANTDWYLPAICEMGYYGVDGNDAGCGLVHTPTTQNIQSNLVDYNSLHLLPPGTYWSATFVSNQRNVAWTEFTDFNAPNSYQRNTSYNNQALYSVCCARAFTF